MSDFSVDGLSSGLDTTSIIEQLMAVEQQPVLRLEARKTDLGLKVSAWQDLDGRLETLGTSIDTLLGDAGVNVLTGTASNADVLVTPSGEGAVGVYEMTVDQVATSHQLMSARFGDPGDLVGAGRATIASGIGNIGASAADIGASETGHYTVQVTSVVAGTAKIVFDGQVHEVPSTGTVTLTNEDGNEVTLTPDGAFKKGTARISTMITGAATTIGAMATQLDDPAGSATVQIVDTGDGTATPFTLVTTARTPGVDNALVIDVTAPGVGAFGEIRAAANTIVTMGEGDLVIERSGVSVAGLVPGMVVDLSGATVGEDLRVTVNRDNEAALGNVQAFVDAANSFFSGVSSYGRSDPENGEVGRLNGEFSLRRLTDQVRGAFSAVGNGTLSIGRQIGVEFAQDGSITFNETTFTELLAADFGDLQAFLVGDGDDGYLARIKGAIETVTETDGVIENATTTLDANIDDLDESIIRYERRLEGVEARYRRQFTAMETLLAQLNSQSSFLSNQLSGSSG